MTTSPHTKAFVRRMIEMLRAGLVDWKHLSPWAADQIEAQDKPPAWICELVSLRHREEIEKCLIEHAYHPESEFFDIDERCDYWIACSFVRYEQGSISWAAFLTAAGRHADGYSSGSEDCSYYYEFLNEVEDSEYDAAVTERQATDVRRLLSGPIAQATADFAPFAAAFRKGAAQRREKS